MWLSVGYGDGFRKTGHHGLRRSGYYYNLLDGRSEGGLIAGGVESVLCSDSDQLQTSWERSKMNRLGGREAIQPCRVGAVAALIFTLPISQELPKGRRIMDNDEALRHNYHFNFQLRGKAEGSTKSCMGARFSLECRRHKLPRNCKISPSLSGPPHSAATLVSLSRPIKTGKPPSCSPGKHQRPALISGSNLPSRQMTNASPLSTTDGIRHEQFHPKFP